MFQHLIANNCFGPRNEGPTGNVQAVKLEKLAVPGQGSGRLVKLDAKMKLGEVVQEVKKLTKLQNLRLATARGKDMGRLKN